MTRGWRRALAAALALGVVVAPAVGLGASMSSVAAGPDDIVVTVPGPSTPGGGDGDITDAQLRWGLNAESGGGSFAGGCNFLSAGLAGDAGGARVWRADDGLYRAQDGRVRIEKPTSDGGWTAATWDTKCLDARGAAVSVASTTSTSGAQVVLDGGVGTRRDGAIRIRWSGSFTVAFYGGMTYWSVTDPELDVDSSGTGSLRGTVSGYGTSMDDMTAWRPLPARSVVLADISAADVRGVRGFTVVPRYLGVATTGAGQTARTAANESHWGSFPQSFVDFHRLTGQQGYWVTTGGVRDAAKPASPLTVSYDASMPVSPPAPAGAGGSAASPSPSNPVRSAPAALAAGAPASALPAVAANTPLTTQPEALALVPGARGGLAPVVAPLLGAAAALSVAIVSVLSLMRALPWQRRTG